MASERVVVKEDFTAVEAVEVEKTVSIEEEQRPTKVGAVPETVVMLVATVVSEEEQASRKMCLASRLEPDVTIVVSGQEFLEYSQMLCSWSDYFEKALTSGMKESKSKRFEFPDRDPKEWEMIVALVKPLASMKLDKSNVFTALSWFSELCSPQGLQECDCVLSSLLEAVVTVASSHEMVLDILDASLNFCLPRSKERSFATVKSILDNAELMPEKAWVQRFITVAQGHKDCLGDMWNALETHLPTSFSEKQKTALLENGLLHEFVFSKLETCHLNGNHPAISAVKAAAAVVNNASSSARAKLKKEPEFRPWRHLLH
ncbi:expressed unknown protein [Seminavis robusta]|uniref:BTB domain-containing protein n=1 Tax=Seminavis robusta TaxID=568900 RepID=A0A9N8DQJ3_9STRA|nr:expressed unknown protein [Seminavis robusta]|eukprot:Sro300_g111640.1 n/a (317) ;mRNA; f:14680-15630